MRRIGVVLAIGVALVLSGCEGSAYPAFDRAATAKDALPADVDIELTEAELQSVRYEASYDDIDFYVVREDTNHVCLLVATSGQSYMTCATEGGAIGVDVPGLIDVQLVPEPARDAYGYLAISDNIRVRP